MALSEDITKIVDVKEDHAISLDKKGLKKIFGSTDNDWPIIAISVLGSPNVGKTMLLNYLLGFLKAGCNQGWANNAEEKFQGFNFGQQTLDKNGITATLVPVILEENKMSVLLLDVNVSDENYQNLPLISKLQSICIALSSIVFYTMPCETEEAVAIMAKQLVTQLLQYFNGENITQSSLYMVIMDATADLFVEEPEDNSSKEKYHSILTDKNLLKNTFEENFMVPLPPHSETLPKNFQGELKHLQKNYKEHIKSFLMNSISIVDLIEIKNSKKCHNNQDDFLQRLQHVVNAGLEKLEHGLSDAPEKISKSFHADRPMQSETLPSTTTKISNQSTKDDRADIDTIDDMEKQIQNQILFLAENIGQCKPELLEKLYSRYDTILKGLESVKHKSKQMKQNKIDENNIDRKIKTLTIEKDCINQLQQLKILTSTKFAEQLYYPIDELKNWITDTKKKCMLNVKKTRIETPVWFEHYMDIMLAKWESINIEIRETEREAVEEAISIALAFYKEKLEKHTEKLIFNPKELEKISDTTIDIINQGLEYGMKLENQNSIAITDFDAILSMKQRADIILEDLKSESMHRNYSILTKAATEAASKAFKLYTTQLQDDIHGIETLKVTKLYEFHNGAKTKAVAVFYKELSTIPVDLIEPFAKLLSDDIDEEHKRIRNAKVNDPKHITTDASILGIQFGLAQIRFGIHRGGNPELYRLSGKSEIPNFISLSDGIHVGKKAKELYSSGKGGFNIAELLLENIGKVHKTTVMGVSQKIDAHLLVALIFEYIKAEANSNFKEDIYKCVISIPNTFDYIQRQLVKDSATLAGFEVIKIMSESSAAAVTFKCAPELQRHCATNHKVSLLVHSYNSDTENDTSSIFNVSQSEIKMVSSCSQAFVKSLKNKTTYAAVKNYFFEATETNIMLDDATSGKKADNGILIISGQAKKAFTPNRSGISDFCKNILPGPSLAVVFGTIYYADLMKSGKTMFIYEALQYGVTLNFSQGKSKSTVIERNTSFPFSRGIDFHLPSPIILLKVQGKSSDLGEYSIDARHKSALYNRGTIVFDFDDSGLLTTKGHLSTNNGIEEMFVTQKTGNMNENKKREVSEKLKQIHFLENQMETQKTLRTDLKNEYDRIKHLAEKKQISNSFKNALLRTFNVCHEVLKDSNSNTELLKQQLECLKKAEETFLQ